MKNLWRVLELMVGVLSALCLYGMFSRQMVGATFFDDRWQQIATQMDTLHRQKSNAEDVARLMVRLAYLECQERRRLGKACP